MSILPKDWEHSNRDEAPTRPPENNRRQAGPLDVLRSLPAGGHPLIFEINGERIEIDPPLLETLEVREQILAALNDVAGAITFDLVHLLEWPSHVCWHVIGLIGRCGEQVTVRATDGGEHSDIFSAVLASMVGDEDLERFQLGKQAAIYAAVLSHPEALPATSGKIAKRLKKLRVAGYSAAALAKEAKSLAGDAEDVAGEEPALPLVVQTLPNAPGPAEAVVPSDWQLTPAGVHAGLGDEAELVATSPIILTGRLRAIDSDEEWLEVAWLRDGRWHREVVRRRLIADSRELLELAASGAPVHSDNARDLVRYLAGYEAVNIDILPISAIAQRLGWQGSGGELGFLHGRELIAPPAHVITPVGDPATPTVPTVPSVITFRGADRGDEQLVNGFSSRGSLAGWQAVVEPLARYPRVQLALYASLATPLLLPLHTRNFVLSYVGAT